MEDCPLLCDAAATLGAWKAGESLAERSLPGLVVSVGSRLQRGWKGAVLGQIRLSLYLALPANGYIPLCVLNSPSLSFSL